MSQNATVNVDIKLGVNKFQNDMRVALINMEFIDA